jgi:hypothetical protein
MEIQRYREHFDTESELAEAGCGEGAMSME